MTKSPSLEQEAAISTNTVGNSRSASQHSPFVPHITLLQQHSPHVLANCFLPAVFPYIEGSNPRALLSAPHFQNASPWSIDHKELSYSAWTLCISKRRKIHLLSFPLIEVLYSLYPANFCITVSLVRGDRASFTDKLTYEQTSSPT